jgi:hypothetical protein
MRSARRVGTMHASAQHTAVASAKTADRPKSSRCTSDRSFGDAPRHGRGPTGGSHRRRTGPCFDVDSESHPEARRVGECRHPGQRFRAASGRTGRRMGVRPPGACGVFGPVAGLARVGGSLRDESRSRCGGEGPRRATAYISEFIEEIKASGFVEKAITRSGWHGVRVAPMAKPQRQK